MPAAKKSEIVVTNQVDLIDRDDNTEAVRFTKNKDGSLNVHRIYRGYSDDGEWTDCTEAEFTFTPEEIVRAVEAASA